MKIIAETGREDIAMVYLAELGPEKYLEFVSSVQPPIPRSEKWVFIVSTLFGCPVGCSICDAGGWYRGRLSKEDIFAQIDFLIKKEYPDNRIPVKKFKIQFARMGEPALNPAVLEVLEEFPQRYIAPGFMPSISTVGPACSTSFFNGLLRIKKQVYTTGNFQMQFSIHSTCDLVRDKLIPIEKWSFREIAAYGEKFYAPGDRKITLNFALAKDTPVSAEILSKYFNPDIFLIKMTPVNPTIQALENKIENALADKASADDLDIVKALRDKGYDVLLSIGELEENKIGSNCGQYVKRFLEGELSAGAQAYQYRVNPT